jgi:alkanesulfonate monooxygenase SsuD/methylene tetrahydromethanopterin reductase-like flavin-dependent oxidoreductase (luciferase family)
MNHNIRFGINVPNFGGVYSDARALSNLAREAEEAGWDGFFLWDHVSQPVKWKIPFVDPWVALTAIAMMTERIKIGTLITPLARRRPWKLARETVSIDHISRGRLILGVGLGVPRDFEAFGEEVDNRTRAEKTDEALDILTGLWTGEEFSYSGKHYQLQKVAFLPKPVQAPRIPVWVAGMWPNKRPFRRAARWDGVVPLSVNFPKDLTPDDLKKIVDYLSPYRQDMRSFDVCVSGTTPTNPEEGVKIVQPYIEAGATWWSESISDMRGSSEEMRERIRQGPTKIQ